MATPPKIPRIDPRLIIEDHSGMPSEWLQSWIGRLRVASMRGEMRPEDWLTAGQIGGYAARIEIDLANSIGPKFLDKLAATLGLHGEDSRDLEKILTIVMELKHRMEGLEK